MGNVCFATNVAGRGEPARVLPDGANRVRTRSVCIFPLPETSSGTSASDIVAPSTTSAPPPLRSGLVSTRIQRMIASRSEFDSELDYRATHSKVHWSELSDEGAGDSTAPLVDHRQHFESLQKDAHWGFFCNEVHDVVLGKKLGEGAQADIYEAQVTFVNPKAYMAAVRYVVKVMKGEYELEVLQQQWPHGIGGLHRFALPNGLGGPKNFQLRGWSRSLYGALVKETATNRSKFGFVMRRSSGDLRKYIDERMEESNGQGPPFPVCETKNFMWSIASSMSILHMAGIIHRDLKAANVLMSHQIDVADWECSVGVVGTGFWRAPEILQQLKERTSSSQVVFDEKADVYSYAMTCYEIATGLLPFEGLPFSETRDGVLEGVRPELPLDLNPGIKEVITSCWNPDPALRPSFEYIADPRLPRALQTFVADCECSSCTRRIKDSEKRLSVVTPSAGVQFPETV